MTTGGSDLLLFIERCVCCSWYDRIDGSDRATGGIVDLCRYYQRPIYDVLECELRGRPLMKRRLADNQKNLSGFG